MYGGREGRWACVQGLVFPFAALCGLLLSQDWPSQSWLWEGWQLSMLCPYEILRQLKKTPKLIIGQGGREYCLSDWRFPVGLWGCRVISSATDLPKLLCCCFSVLSLSEAVTFVLCEYMKGTAETRSFFERKSVISGFSWSQYEPYVTSNLYSFSLVYSCYA